LLAPGYTETHYAVDGQPVTVAPNHTVGAGGMGLAHLCFSGDAWRTMKYMELFIVADHTLYRNQNLNLGHTKQRIVEIANYVDKV
ncbi:Disintegrin and metalloproteinase domain-containing protein 33, partial [Aptenodytes patagonicus]